MPNKPSDRMTKNVSEERFNSYVENDKEVASLLASEPKDDGSPLLEFQVKPGDAVAIDLLLQNFLLISYKARSFGITYDAIAGHYVLRFYRNNEDSEPVSSVTCSNIETMDKGDAMSLLDTLCHRFEMVTVNRKMFYGDDTPAVQAMKEFCRSHSHVPVPIEDWEFMQDKVSSLSGEINSLTAIFEGTK